MKRRHCQLIAAMLALALLLTPVWGQARYATLEFGSRGSAVLKLQRTLLALGYDPAGTDGKFGRGTENAVKAFQQANGLEADGKAGHLTQSLLYDRSDGAAAAAAATSTNPNTLKFGDAGSRVTDLQTALKKLGYYTGDVDGRFGASTQRAVSAFQRACGLKNDGLAGTQTLKRLEEKASGVSQTTSPVTDTSAATGFVRTLRRGYIGNDVLAVQNRLKELGYYAGLIDGEYGSGCIAAIKAFQRASGLTADGLAGRQTWNQLMSASAVKAPASLSSASAAVSTATGYAQLASGDRGDAVKQLQKALQALNYNVSADGAYGPETISAVKAFQQLNGLAVDGVAGAGLQALLNSGNAVRYTGSGMSSSAASASFGTVEGPSGGSVKLLHWFNEVKPTLSTGDTLLLYDPATRLQWKLRVYSRGRHCDCEPRTAEDTAAMNQAFGGQQTWTPKPVYVHLPNGSWTLATTHNVPHESGSIKENDFNGHLCVHFLRDLEECKQNDPNYGVTNQNAIRKAWKSLTGITVD